MATTSVRNEGPTYYTQIISVLESVQKTLFENPDEENPKIKKDIESKELLETIKSIKLFMDLFKIQFDHFKRTNEKLQKKLAATSSSVSPGNEIGSSSSSSLNFAEITYYEKIISDVKNLKGILDKLLNSRAEKLEKYSRKLKDTIESINVAVSLQHDFREKMDRKLSKKLSSSPESISGVPYKSQSDGALPGLSRNERLFTPEYVRGLREQNIELAKALNKKRDELNELHEVLKANLELSHHNELLREKLAQTVNKYFELEGQLKSSSIRDDSEKAGID